MPQATAKIYQLQDYLKRGDEIANEAIQALLVEERAKIRSLDSDVSELLAEKHTLKDVEPFKDLTIIAERNLLLVSDWLEDKIADAKNEAEKALKKELKEQCDRLLKRNERIEKKLTDDMAARRFYESPNILNPVQVGSLVISATVAGIAIAKGIFDSKPQELVEAAGGGMAVGAGITFYRQIGKAFKDAANAAVSVPNSVNKSFTVYYVKTSARNTAISMAWAFSVYAKRADKIAVQKPERNEITVVPQSPKLKLHR